MDNDWQGEGIKPEDIIPLQVAGPGVPDSIKKLQPILYKDGDAFCVLAGSDPVTGTFGCGPTIEAHSGKI